MVAAILYGIVHDQITARVCVEYFTIGHPPVFDTEDPTLLGIGWGIIATWWVGALLGLLLARAALTGPSPPRTVRSLVRPVALLMLVTGVAALVAGLAGWIAAGQGWVVLLEPLANELPPEKHRAFLADLWAHTTSYFVGAVGGGLVCIRVWKTRNRNSVT
jgi:hypothetical protein